jgi:hypothetical protein
MRSLFLFCAAMAWGQSHPSWWTYVPRDTTALVGLNWEALQHSVLGDAVESELSSGAAVPVFEFESLRGAREILLSPPLAIVNGDIAQQALRTQAALKGLKKIAYRGIELWTSPALSLAIFNSQLVLVGSRQALEQAIDRLPSEKIPAEKEGDALGYSPLLVRAAQHTQDDLWVVASSLPDPLADRFVPLETEAGGFSGGLSLKNGLRLQATLDAAPGRPAEALAAQLRNSASSWPSLMRGMRIAAGEGEVNLALDIPAEQVRASLRGQSQPGPAPEKAEVARPAIAAVSVNGAPVPVSPAASESAPNSTKPTEAPQAVAIAAPTPQQAQAPATKPQAPARQVVRIIGLDEGIREIELPPAQ